MEGKVSIQEPTADEVGGRKGSRKFGVGITKKGGTNEDWQTGNLTPERKMNITNLGIKGLLTRT